MAGLKFDVVVRLDRLVKLKEEIDKTKKRIEELQSTGDSKSANKLVKSLNKLSYEYTSLRDEITKTANKLRSSGKDFEVAEKDVNRVTSSLLKLGGIAFSLNFAKNLASEIVSVRGEIQQLEIAFETMLNSKEKADRMMADIKKLALYTPFTLTEVASNTKQLIAMGIASENAIETMKALGDVAAGVSVPISRIAVNYGQVAALGKLQAREIRDFAMAGIPIVDELSKMLGKSSAEISEMVEAGKIGFPEVEQAFKNMSGEGGRFYNLMEKQNSSVTGQISKLQDELQMMFNTIGQESESIIYGAIETASDLIANYEKIGKILVEMVVAYGSYKAAVIALSTIEKLRYQATLIQMAGMTKMQIVMDVLRKKTEALNIAMAKNPYALIAASVVALGYGLYKLSTYQSEYELAQKRLSDATDEVTNSLVGEMRKLDNYERKLKETERGTDEYKKLKGEIIKQYGKYYAGLDEEIEKVGSLSIAYESLSSSIRKSIAERKFESFFQAEQENLDNVIGDNLNKAYDSLIKKFGKEKGGDLYKQLFDYAIRDIEMPNDVWKDLTKTTVGGLFGISTENVTGLVLEINNAKKASDHAINKFKELYEISESAENQNIEGGVLEKRFVNVQKEVGNTINKIAELKQEIADLRSGKTQVEVGVSLSDTIDEKVKELNDAEKKLSTLTGIDKKEVKKNQSKTAKRQLNDQERINEEIRKMTERNISDRIALMDEGTQKELTQIKDKYNKAIAEIKKRESEWKKAQGGSLTFEQDVIIHTATVNADSERTKSEHAIIKSLVEKYKDYADQRLDIEKKFNKDIEVLQEERSKAEASGNTEMTYQLNRAIAKATKDKGTELISFDFDLLKKSPEYVRAFEDLKNTSTETLNSLLSQLEAMKGNAAEVLDPADLQTYTSIIQQIIDELAERNPFQTLANAQNSLVKANQNLAKARNNLDKAIDSGNTEEIARATIKYNEALDESTKTSRDVEKAQKKVTDAIGGLYDALSGVGNAIGGTAGEIINFIADIGKFVLTTSEGMKTTAEGASRAIAMIEKASAILFIIQMAIQLISQLQSFIKDAHQQYLDYSKEIAQINALRDAVTEYQISVLKAKQAQDSWFGNDNLKNLKHEWELNGKYAEAYSKKLNEDQAKYQNEMGGGWLTNTVQWLGDAYGKTLGKVYDITVGKVSETLMGDIGKTIADVGEAASFGLGTQAELEKYNKETVKALENLRIETRAAKKGFLGSGIGRKSQRTEDLRTWARENGFGELFDENNIIDTSVAEAILKANEEGTIKLVGETEKTLEALKEYQELYEEYQNKLQEYVSNLYEPLVDNFVDAMWDWFDNGKNALDSFKEYASDTFRDIVSDMIRTIVINDVFGSFADDVKNLYTEYFQGKMTEDQLMEEVSKLTNKVMDNAEKQLPGLENVINTISDSLKNAGIDIMQPGEASENTLKGAFAKASQESIDLLAGQTGAVRVALEDIRRMMLDDESGLRDEYYASFQNSLNVIRDIQVSGLNEMVAIREISGRVEGLTGEIRDLNNRIADSNEQISVNTKRSADNSDAVVSAGIKLKSGGLGA